jgi:diguanylate cyclase (GGDEF)-like protein
MQVSERRRPTAVSASVRRRFEVSQALELRRRVRTIPPIGAVLFLASGLLLAVRHPDSAIAIMAVNTLAAVVVLAIRPLVAHASLRRVIGLSLLLPTVAGATLVALIVIEPGTFANGLASLAIIPVATPLLLAWDVATNRRWAVAYGLVVGVLAVLTGFGSLSPVQRFDLASMVGMSCAVGVLVANQLQGLRMKSIELEVELRLLNRELHGYATRDPLTQLRNRRQLDDDVAIIWPPRAQHGGPFAVVMFDLDRFKQLNDARGHPAGDLTLQSVARELDRQVRGRDRVYRVGGEEFLVVLRDTTLEGAMLVADRIRVAISGLALPNRSGVKPTSLTVTGGVALADEQATSWDSVVALADAALYAAKEAGRNRVYGPAATGARAA